MIARSSGGISQYEELNQQEGNFIMSWLETSIMARRGLAKGKPGKSYSITEQSQG